MRSDPDFSDRLRMTEERRENIWLTTQIMHQRDTGGPTLRSTSTVMPEEKEAVTDKDEEAEDMDNDTEDVPAQENRDDETNIPVAMDADMTDGELREDRKRSASDIPGEDRPSDKAQRIENVERTDNQKAF